MSRKNADHPTVRWRGVSLQDLATQTWVEIRADDVFGRAAQLAYYFFLSLFPFLICIVASLSIFGSADRGRAILFALFARLLPGQVSQLISSNFDQIVRAGGPLKMSAGIIASLWSASMGVSAMMNTLNAAYNVKETRSFIKQYTVAVGLTIAMGILVVLALLAVVFGHTLMGGEFSGARALRLAWNIIKWPLGLALLLLLFAITYYFAPNLRNRQWHWVSPGAIAGVLLLAIVSAVLRLYFHYSGASATTYGSLGAVVALLLSFYLWGIAVLAGGILNGVLESMERKGSLENEARALR